MSETMITLRQKIKSAGDLQGVVRTMKTLAASNIGQYEKSLLALTDYRRTVELGLRVCFGKNESSSFTLNENEAGNTETAFVIVFGSDQGLVGRFNEVIVDYVIKILTTLPGKPKIWAVGERVYSRLGDRGLSVMGLFNLPNSVRAIPELIGQIQLESEVYLGKDENAPGYVFHNCPSSGSLYEPIYQQLLPLGTLWQANFSKISWPNTNLPEVMINFTTTLRALIREYLFISLFRACAESLASENISRLAAMERADKNIEELLANFHSAFHHLRQSSIDEELFDVIAGYESFLTKSK